MILTHNVLNGTFIANQESPYYQSAQFTAVLNFIQRNPNKVKMSEKNGKLRLRIDHVKTLTQALDWLGEILPH